MNHFTSSYLLIGFLIGLSSCNGQDQKGQSLEKQKEVHPTTPLATFLSVEQSDTIVLQNAPSRITRKIRNTKRGQLLFAAYEDIILYDGNTYTKLPKAPNFESLDAFDAMEDSKGNIWVASTHFGVFRYDGQASSHFTTENGLANNRTMDLREDSNGDIWIATMEGLNRFDGTSFQTFTSKDGLTNNDINVMMEDINGKIWLGTRGAPSIFDPTTSTFKPIPEIDSRPALNVWSILEDQNGQIWMGGQSGVYRIRQDVCTLISSEPMTSLSEDQFGNIWAITPKGKLFYFDQKSTLQDSILPTQVFKADQMFFRVFADDQGNIWIGALKGVYQYDGKSVRYFQNENK